MVKLNVLLTVVIITSFLLIGVNQAVGAQELQSDRLSEILLTRVNAILIHLFGEIPAGCEYANPLCADGESCVDNVCVDNDTDPVLLSGHPYQLDHGWNTLSPVTGDMVGVNFQDLFPNAVSLYSFDGSYNNVDTMELGLGYFIKNDRDETVHIDGPVPTSVIYPFDGADTFFIGTPFPIDLTGLSCITEVNQYDENNPATTSLSNSDYRIDYTLDSGEAAFVTTDRACTVSCTASGGCAEAGPGLLCTDSDGGKDYSHRGTTSVCPENPEVMMPCTAIEDHCEGDAVVEGFCSDPAQSSSVKHTCPDGCLDGRCLAAASEIGDGPVVLISYYNGDEYVPLAYDTSISLPQSYPTFSVSITDDDARTVYCQFYDDTSGSLSSDGEVHEFDNPIVLEPVPMVDSDFDPAEPALADGTYRFEVVCEDDGANVGSSGVLRFQWKSTYVPGDCTFRTNAVDGNYRSGTWIALDVDGDSDLDGLGYTGSTGMLNACMAGTVIAGTPEGYPVVMDAAGAVSVCQPVSDTKVAMKKYGTTSSAADTSTTPRSPYDVNNQEVCDGSSTNPGIDFTETDDDGGTTVSGTIITGTG